MIHVHAKLIIAADKVDRFLELTTELITETRLEDGCCRYDLYRDNNCFCFVEDWESREHLAAHWETAHFTRIVPQIKELCCEEGSTDVLEPANEA